ncbi:MAG: hypothetical protein HOV83_02660 [Catenulispora sp.]|nr:hypothetical protein [Catenulispora sp.]
MTGSYAAAGLVFLGLFLLGGSFSLFKQASGNGNMRVMSLLLVLSAGMSLTAGVMRW